MYRVGRFAVAARTELLLVALMAPILIHASAIAFWVVGRMRWHRIRQRLERVWSWLVLRVLKVRATIVGGDHLPDSSAILLPSTRDFLMRRSMRFLARDELFEWPQLGRVLRSGRHILVPTRPALSEIRRVQAEIGATLAAGHDVVMFPQGSILGVEVAFADGARRLAARFEVPIVPIVITGTHRVWEHPYAPTLRRGQSVRMQVLAPLPPHISTEEWRANERTMKRIALSQVESPVRHFVPERDGYWPGYGYEIDPDFADLAHQVDGHRASTPACSDPSGVVGPDRKRRA